MRKNRILFLIVVKSYAFKIRYFCGFNNTALSNFKSESVSKLITVLFCKEIGSGIGADEELLFMKIQIEPF